MFLVSFKHIVALFEEAQAQEDEKFINGKVHSLSLLTAVVDYFLERGTSSSRTSHWDFHI